MQNSLLGLGPDDKFQGRSFWDKSVPWVIATVFAIAFIVLSVKMIYPVVIDLLHH